MAAGDAIQVGTQYLIGYNNTYYQGYVLSASTYNLESDSSEHKDQRGATDSILYQNPRKALSITVDLPASFDASTDMPRPGDIVQAKGAADNTSVGWRVVSASLTQGTGVNTATFSLIREDSMAATYDA